MRTKLEIRQATEKDLPTIFSLVKSLAEHVNLTHEISASAEDFRECIFGTNGFVEALIGYFEAQPVAMLIFYPSFSTFIGKPAIHIEDFYIKSEFRGMGIGKTIFKYLANLALSRDCGKIEWYAAEWNEKALEFYSKMGAEKLDKRKLFRLSAESMQSLVNQ
ncbi:MAG: GNAT family N-acetyltransferase [Deltaproteobacteria bacterium]|jgi:GNAT superfamily N-acetyltransferase|nr:GNAT family N-acetyltransferase [Deltaproteobacteria bacterium]MBT4638762.1 GNAT family N-acetyltransferase [Deltaproteobacteria bacterium]